MAYAVTLGMRYTDDLGMSWASFLNYEVWRMPDGDLKLAQANFLKLHDY